MVFITFSVYAEEPVVQDEIITADGSMRSTPDDLYVSFHFSWSGNVVHYGDKITLVPELRGYEGLNYCLTWQYSLDDVNWVDWPNNTYIVTEDNVDWYWRLVVDIQTDK